MMNLLNEIHQQLLKELLNSDVEFIIIGGYSVIYHGYSRLMLCNAELAEEPLVIHTMVW